MLGGIRSHVLANSGSDFQCLIFIQLGGLKPQGPQRGDDLVIGQSGGLRKELLLDRLLQSLAAHQAIRSAGDPADEEALETELPGTAISPSANPADTGAIGKLVFIGFSDE